MLYQRVPCTFKGQLQLTHRSCVPSPPKRLCVRWASFCWKPAQSVETWPLRPNPSGERSDPPDPERGSLPEATKHSFHPPRVTCAMLLSIVYIKKGIYSIIPEYYGTVPGMFFVNSTKTWTWLVAISVNRRKFSSGLYWSCSCRDKTKCKQKQQMNREKMQQAAHIPPAVNWYV